MASVGKFEIESYKRGGIALAIAVAIALGSWSFADVDGDGLSGSLESRIGTNAALSDSDGDGLSDGFEFRGTSDPMLPDSDRDGIDDGIEYSISSSAVVLDTDQDGISDYDEWRASSDPSKIDSDGDGIPDGSEPDADCDDDGYEAVVDPDDDDDGIADGSELPRWRCNADVDDDGVVDGDEGNVICVESIDCDADGLNDVDEMAHGANPLQANSLHPSFPDGVFVAFQAGAGGPGMDGDQDGIPDNWEGQSDFIDWGNLTPEVNRTDVLIEFVRVAEANTTDIEDIKFESAYQQIVEAFANQGTVTVTWTETWINLTEVQRAPVIPSAFAAYYRSLLPTTSYAANPYVTSVFMNPYHDQSEALHVGVAPIRGMLAAVDYSAHTQVDYFRPGVIPSETSMSPVIESLIAGGRSDAILAMGFIDYGWEDNRMCLEDWDYIVCWTPFWYADAPVITFDNGGSYRYSEAGWRVETDELAKTIMHELGHSFGLCHTHLDKCAANLTDEDQFQRHASVMSYEHDGDLQFLPSEWSTVLEHISCPPQAPVAALAEDEATSTIIEAKYAYSLQNVSNLSTRSCGEFAFLEANLTADEDLAPRPVKPIPLEPLAHSGLRVAGFMLAWLLAGAAAFLVGAIRWGALGAGPEEVANGTDMEEIAVEPNDEDLWQAKPPSK